MTVSIDIDLDAIDAIQEIASLKLALKSLEEDLDLDLDLDGDLGKTLDNLSETMDNLSEALTSDLNDTIDRLEGLELDDINLLRGNGDSGGDTGSDSGDYIPSAAQYFNGGPFEDDSGKRTPIKQAVDKFHRNVKGLGDAFSLAEQRIDTSLGDTGDSSVSDGMTHREILKNAARRGGVGTFSGMMDSVRESGRFGDNPFSGRGSDSRGHMRGVSKAFRIGDDISDLMPGSGRRGGILNGLSKQFRNIGRSVNGLTASFKSLIPNMQMWWSLIGAAIPALGAMAIQALGVASAMGAIAVAGAAVMGLGLLGGGDTMAESFRNAKEEVDELKKNLFEEFEPTADLFSGVQAEFFDFIPGEMTRISKSMEGLLAYKEDFFSLFRGATQFVSKLVGVITDNVDIVSQLSHEFSKIIGQNIIKFFDWLLTTTYENKQMLIDLGGIFKTVAIAMYEVFMMISRSIIMFGDFFNIVKFLAKLLNNPFVSGLVGVIGLMYILVSVATTVYGALLAVGTVLMSGMVPGLSAAFLMLQGYIFNALLATSASYALAQGIATVVAAATLLTGIGIAAWAGTQMVQGLQQVNDIKNQMGEGSGNFAGGSSGGGSTVINEGNTVNVDMRGAGNPEKEKFDDMGGGNGNLGPTGGAYTE